jgi:hypothetical protein
MTLMKSEPQTVIVAQIIVRSKALSVQVLFSARKLPDNNFVRANHNFETRMRNG